MQRFLSVQHGFGIGAALLTLAGAGGQTAVPWSTVASGGGRVVGANGYAIECTIGEHDATPEPVAGSSVYALAGGFWPGVAVTPICLADFNNSGSPPTVQDIFDFLAAYFSDDPRADFNRSGAISVQDIFDFLAAYFAEC